MSAPRPSSSKARSPTARWWTTILQSHRIEAVVHFAGSVVVPESVANPLKYYQNNSGASAALVQACLRQWVRNFVFSSTAAVYGVPDLRHGVGRLSHRPHQSLWPFQADDGMAAGQMSPAAHDFRYVALRYFNVAGADPKGRTGQSTATPPI